MPQLNDDSGDDDDDAQQLDDDSGDDNDVIGVDFVFNADSYPNSSTKDINRILANNLKQVPANSLKSLKLSNLGASACQVVYENIVNQQNIEVQIFAYFNFLSIVLHQQLLLFVSLYSLLSLRRHEFVN